MFASIPPALPNLLFLLVANCVYVNVWVFIAHVVEHRSANVEAICSNSVEVPKFFFFPGEFAIQCLNCHYHCDDHIVI